jgi:colicin import membrane protein
MAKAKFRVVDGKCQLPRIEGQPPKFAYKGEVIEVDEEFPAKFKGKFERLAAPVAPNPAEQARLLQQAKAKADTEARAKAKRDAELKSQAASTKAKAEAEARAAAAAKAKAEALARTQAGSTAAPAAKVPAAKVAN